MAMPWGLGWKRPSEIFRMILDYGGEPDADDDTGDPASPRPASPSGDPIARIDLEWIAGDDEEQVSLRLQSQLMVALPAPHDNVSVDLVHDEGGDEEGKVLVEMKVVKKREPLRFVKMYRSGGSGQQSDGLGVLSRLLRSSLDPSGLAEHWQSLSVVSLRGCGLSFYGRVMAELRVLRLFGNPLEFLPEILPLHNLRQLSLANIIIEATENLKTVDVKIEMDDSSYFTASRHKLSAFFALIFRFFSCHHPLLASALAKLMEDHSNRVAISKEENAMRQLISMISSGNRHVVEQACFALSSLASDVSLAMHLIKSDIMQPIESVLKSVDQEELISVLQVVVTLAFNSDSVAQKVLTKDVLKSLKLLCAHKNMEVQWLSLYAVGNLAFCPENRHMLTQSESL